jgi:uncharacterized protein YbbC (DUF1343 family)
MILFGVDNLLLNNCIWKNKKIGLVTNNAATTNVLEPTRKALLKAGFNIIKLFSPEHGLTVKGADGVYIQNSTDELTHLPIISLYGNQLKPTRNDLEDVDILLFDIPDIGCRFYTYLWTMTYVLESAAELNKPIIILDRPNPVSGIFELSESYGLDEENCSSFIGRFNIPIRHSCTLGELALFFNATKHIGANLEIIAVKNWSREMFQPDWNLPFVPTSPAIKNSNAAILYSGLGMLEATNMSEGRGTDFAFEILGAPWLNHIQLCNLFNNLQDDVVLKPIQFTPCESKYKNQNCNGVTIEVTNNATYKSVYTALLLIKTIKEMNRDDFSWSNYPTLVNATGQKHLDKLLGVLNSQHIFDLPIQLFLKETNRITNANNWHNAIKNYLLY